MRRTLIGVALLGLIAAGCAYPRDFYDGHHDGWDGHGGGWDHHDDWRHDHSDWHHRNDWRR